MIIKQEINIKVTHWLRRMQMIRLASRPPHPFLLEAVGHQRACSAVTICSFLARTGRNATDVAAPGH